MRNGNINDKIPIISSQVRWLLKHGAKVKSDKYGKTPLSDAAENKQLEVEMHFSSFVMLIIFFYIFTFKVLTIENKAMARKNKLRGGAKPPFPNEMLLDSNLPNHFPFYSF